MSEYFLRLDPYNYDTEIDYLLDNEIFSFEEFKNLYQNGEISEDEFEQVKNFYGIQKD